MFGGGETMGFVCLKATLWHLFLVLEFYPSLSILYLCVLTFMLKTIPLCSLLFRLAKDVIKAVKKRLLHKNPKVQLLALTLLETMVKNCDDYVHFQIADRNILQEMVKIVKKKERKKIVKGMKGQVEKIAHDKCGNMVLVSILSIVDDTKLLSKIIIRELEEILKELVFDQNGRRPLLQLLHPNCSRYFSPDDLTSLSYSIPSLSTKQIEISDVNEASNEDIGATAEITAEANSSKSAGMSLDVSEIAKKDPLTRRNELLIQSGLAEKLIDICCEMAEDLLRSKFGKELIYEVVTGGADGILHSTMDIKIGKLHENIASLVAEPKSEGAENDHLLENFHSSRTIRKLILDSFASKLWEKALKGKCASWAQGHSSKVIGAFLETSDLDLRKTATKELQPLVDSGVLRLPTVVESAKSLIVDQ